MDPDSVSLEFGIDIQAAVAERLAQKNKKTVQLNDLLKDTKFTKSEIRTMYRGFKQVSLLRLFNLHISFSLLNRMYSRWVSVVEFHDRTLGIGKVFGQESIVVKWNYQILDLHQVTVCHFSNKVV